MNEKEFLASYDRKDYLSPLLTVDAVLFTYHENTLKVLLVERASFPEKGNGAYREDLLMSKMIKP